MALRLILDGYFDPQGIPDTEIVQVVQSSFGKEHHYEMLRWNVLPDGEDIDIDQNASFVCKAREFEALARKGLAKLHLREDYYIAWSKAHHAWVIPSFEDFSTTEAASLFVKLAGELGTPSQNLERTMLEHLIKLYTAAQAMDVRSLIPHLVGPPGVGKSQVCRRLAEFAGVNLHVVNVSRLSPLEIEGVQMPTGTGDKQRLKLLLNSLWGNLQEGDIVLFDEFLRGFPEVYNGLLDIITDREVGGIKLPKVFFVAASNSVATYDKALEDRLLHIFVPDLRNSAAARTKAKELLANEIGLLPAVVKSQEMDTLFMQEVLPMYDMLDYFKGKASVGSALSVRGHSIRNLVAQAKLREVQSSALTDLIVLNNQLATSQRKWQYVVLLSTRKVDPRYISEARKLQGNARLTEIQALNLDLNLAFIEAQEALQETEETLTKEEADDLVI